MTEQRRKKIVYTALVLAIIYGAYNFMGERKPVQVTPPATIRPITAEMPAQAGTDSIDMTAIATADWGRDPFRSPRRVKSPEVSWEVKGIVYSPTEPMAYINGKRVGINDSVDGARVISIERKKVTMERGGRRFNLYVVEG